MRPKCSRKSTACSNMERPMTLARMPRAGGLSSPSLALSRRRGPGRACQASCCLLDTGRHVVDGLHKRSQWATTIARLTRPGPIAGLAPSKHRFETGTQAPLPHLSIGTGVTLSSGGPRWRNWNYTFCHGLRAGSVFQGAHCRSHKVCCSQRFGIATRPAPLGADS